MSEAVLQVNNLSVGYAEHCVIKNLSFQINKGELVGIIGCNGAGKSTLLKTLRGLLPRQNGEIFFEKKELACYSDKELAKKVAYLQQHMEIGFGYTAKEIVLAGRYPYISWWQTESKADEILALECMKYTGTYDLADKLINAVSGGQKQRILLAKVLAQQTPILFLDEPTTGLDVVYKEEIFRFAKELVAMGKTVLMVVHELQLAAKYCSRILLLGQGRLLADGSADEVFTEQNLSKAYAADIEIIRNPVNNSLEITTHINNAATAEKIALLHKICADSL